MVKSFKTKDEQFEFTVKTEFFTEVPNAEELPTYELLVNKGIQNYFHNPNGPAIVHIQTKEEAFFLDGKEVNEEDAKKIKHNGQFNDRLDNLINEKE